MTHRDVLALRIRYDLLVGMPWPTERGVQGAHRVTGSRLTQARKKTVHERGQGAHEQAPAEAMREAQVLEISLARRTWMLEKGPIDECHGVPADPVMRLRVVPTLNG
jgi:hypothetical protein